MSERLDKLMEGWQQRAIRATGGNGSKLGLIVLAVVGQSPTNLPMISLRRGAVITKDGYVVCDVWLKGQREYIANSIGTVRDIVDSFRGLADHLKFTDGDRTAMFDELRKWMGTDLRATSDLSEWKKDIKRVQ